MTATPQSRGQVMSFSKNAVICLTKLKQASNGFLAIQEQERVCVSICGNE
jgi:hypothetical protein